MSLITCPKCGKTISEKAITCPHCKFNLSQQNLIVCDECGREYEMKFSACPNCGFPNSTIEKKKQKKKVPVIQISIKKSMRKNSVIKRRKSINPKQRHIK